jgi:hypothetical protein
MSSVATPMSHINGREEVAEDELQGEALKLPLETGGHPGVDPCGIAELQEDS